MSTAKKKLTTCEPKTAVAYARYSSASQRDVSIDQQLKDIREYAEREGYTIIHEYADHAKSGYKKSERRAEFQAMLRAASSGAFDTVLAWKVDRFGRNRRESSAYKGQLADLGVSVVYAMEPIPDGAAGVLTEGMLEAIAEWYSRNLSENVRRGRMDNARKCLYNGVKLFGYRTDGNGHYVIYEPEAAIVRRIFSLYAQGNSAADVQRIITDEGVRNKNGDPFHISRIIHTIQNESYCGVYKYETERHPGGMPAIIDQETWEVCKDLRAKTSKHYKKRNFDYTLSGKCSCGYCGSNVRGVSGVGRGKWYYYYQCGNQKSNGKVACDLKSYKTDIMENAIFDFIFDNLLRGKAFDQFVDAVYDTLNEYNAESPIRQMETSLNDINRRIDNINTAISEGIWTKSTAAMLDNLTAQAEALKKDIAYHQITASQTISKDRVRFYLQKIADGKRNDTEFLKSLVNSYINSITVYNDCLRVVVNAAENVERIPADELPPIDELPLFERFDFQPSASNRLVTVEPYPVIVFKIAI